MFSRNPQRLERKAELKETYLKNKILINDLANQGKGLYIMENLEKFPGLNIDIVSKLISSGQGECVVDNLEKFEGFKELDYAFVILKLIGTGQGRFFHENQNKFPIKKEWLQGYDDIYVNPHGFTDYPYNHKLYVPGQDNKKRSANYDNYDAPRWPSDNKVPHR